eukprot:2388444-Rhodomonas_salina.2
MARVRTGRAVFQIDAREWVVPGDAGTSELVATHPRVSTWTVGSIPAHVARYTAPGQSGPPSRIASHTTPNS